MSSTDINHTLLHREEVPGKYIIEMYRRSAPTGILCTWRHDYIVEIREGDENAPSYQFVSVRENEAQVRFIAECARLARKWRKA